MATKSANERIILGLKVKQLRQQQQLSFAALALETGMSVSYLNEIEKGKKFPKPDKIDLLAKALGSSTERLLNGKLGRSYEPVEQLLRSNFLNDLPLDVFGIELSKIAEIIASAPAQVGAFISALLELSRTYSVREENFYFAALRAYLELHENYFEDIEAAVKKFCLAQQIPSDRPLPPEVLAKVLRQLYGYHIVVDGLDAFPDLRHLRAVYLSPSKKLLLNSRLKTQQQAFQFGKEIGFNVLGISNRATTSSILRAGSFEEVLNHSKATYFSVALLLPLHDFEQRISTFFQLPTWDGKAFVQLMQSYNASPEMLYHRLTNVLPKFFGIPRLFFLRFLHEPGQNEFVIDKELHLSQHHHPHGNALHEHYCRRWISLSLLKDLERMQAEGIYTEQIVNVQRSRYLGTADEYLCITLARPGYPSPERNVSLTLGLLIDEDVKRKIKWLGDPSIQNREVHTTCERCPLTDCQERSAAPSIVSRKEQYKRSQLALDRLQ